MAQKLYFTIEELNNHKVQLTEEQTNNLKVLIERLSVIREKYGKPFVVTSGVRSIQDQMRINPNAPKSAHLLGMAVDISDHDGELKKWLLANIHILEEADLYCEDFKTTVTWVHFQTRKASKRVFMP